LAFIFRRDRNGDLSKNTKDLSGGEESFLEKQQLRIARGSLGKRREACAVRLFFWFTRFTKADAQRGSGTLTLVLQLSHWFPPIKTIAYVKAPAVQGSTQIPLRLRNTRPSDRLGGKI